MLYMKNSYRLWEDLIHKTKGNYQLLEKHIQKWIRELEQCLIYEYRVLGCSYLTQMAELALKDRTKKIPYALFEAFRFIMADVERRELPSLVKKVFADTKYICTEEEEKELSGMFGKLEQLYGASAKGEQKAADGADILLKELEQGREENKKVLEEELKAARKSMWEQMLYDLEEEKKATEEELKKEKEEIAALKEEAEKMKGEVLERVKKSAAYELRLEEEDRYLETVVSDIKRREHFEEDLCHTLHGVSSGFNDNMKFLTQKLMENMDQIVEIMRDETGRIVDEMRKNTANAINQVVDTERNLRKDDFEPLLRIYGELQELVYYTDIPQESLGLERTKISHYSRRFLKVLNRLGYFEYLPNEGEAYDSYYHTAEEEPEDGAYEVAEVISCGFLKGEDVCLPAKVKLRRSV